MNNDEIQDSQIRADLAKTFLEIHIMQKNVYWYGIKVWLPSLVAIGAALIAIIKWG